MDLPVFFVRIVALLDNYFFNPLRKLRNATLKVYHSIKDSFTEHTYEFLTVFVILLAMTFCFMLVLYVSLRRKFLKPVDNYEFMRERLLSNAERIIPNYSYPPTSDELLNAAIREYFMTEENATGTPNVTLKESKPGE